MLDSDKELDIELKSKTLTHLRRVCGRYGIVPTSYVLAGVVRDQPVPQKTGIVTETWRGSYEKTPVAIKIFKITEGRKDYDKIKTVRRVVLAPRLTGPLTARRSRHSQRFCKEAVLWKRLTHKNILPFLGISKDVAEFCLITPWMKNGTIVEYVANNPHVNPLELVCMIPGDPHHSCPFTTTCSHSSKTQPTD